MPTQRSRAVLRVLVIEGLGNFVIAAAKLGVGLATGSLALIAEALHSATDLANNVFGGIAVKVSSAPPDENHPYGHAKFETLAIFVLGTLMSVLAIELLLSIVRRGDDHEVESSTTGLAIVVGALVFQLGLAAWQRRKADELESELLAADAAHTLVDSSTGFAALIGWQLGARGYVWADVLLSIVVAGFVFSLAFRLFQRAIPILVDGAAIHPDELVRVVRAVPGVLEVGRARSRWDGSLCVADVTIRVDASLDTVGSHAVADAVEERLETKLDIADVVVHVEPMPPTSRTHDTSR